VSDDRDVVSLIGPAAQTLADAWGVGYDLAFVMHTCIRLEAEVLKPQYRQVAEIGGSDTFAAESLWTSALVVYYRAFESGRSKFRFQKDHVAKLGPDAVKLHERYMKLRSKSAAHAVRPFYAVEIVGILDADLREVLRVVPLGRQPVDQLPAITELRNHVTNLMRFLDNELIPRFTAEALTEARATFAAE
jgi:hypothetical protein